MAASPPNALRVLYITRKFPPQVGGMEALSAGIASVLRANFAATVISWGGRQWALPLFVIVAALRAAALCATRRIDYVHMGDVLLAPIGIVLRGLFAVPVTVTAHGLDVTWRFPGYRALAGAWLRSVDGVVAISRATRDECTRRGVAPDRCVVIPPGIVVDAGRARPDRAELSRMARIQLAHRPVLITVGRLVPRKGVRWFIDRVVPRLPGDIVYLVVGDGPEREAIAATIAARGLDDRVRLLGRLSDDALALAYASADAFVMPNIDVPGDPEGFGMVAIEAGLAGLPVVASNLQGIPDAVVEGAGRVVEPGSEEMFLEAIRETLSEPIDRSLIRDRVAQRFAWPVISEQWVAFVRATYERFAAPVEDASRSRSTNR